MGSLFSNPFSLGWFKTESSLLLKLHINWLIYISCFSVKHEYDGTWNENDHLTTCDPHAKRTVSSSNSPQEVEDKQEVIFTYDVVYQVMSSKAYFPAFISSNMLFVLLIHWSVVFRRAR